MYVLVPGLFEQIFFKQDTLRIDSILKNTRKQVTNDHCCSNLVKGLFNLEDIHLKNHGFGHS